MRSKLRIFPCILLILSLVFCFSGCNGDNTPVTKEIYALDTIITISVYGADDEVFRDTEAEIRRLESLLSVTDIESDISRINSSPDEWVRVDDETFSLITLSKQISANTMGNFDITVYPAVKLWGFTSEVYNVPSENEINNISDYIDYNNVETDELTSSVRIPQGYSLDLGAIAKGYVADKGAEILEKSGVSSALLNFGGNIRLIGSKPDGSSWKIGVKTPFKEDYFATLSLENVTASTAGGYERYFEDSGIIYHHILNPHTASPSESDVLSATVVGKDGEICDALATSAFVAGTKGIEDISHKYPDYSFVLYTDTSIFVSKSLEDSFTLTDGYINTDIIFI